MKKGVEFFIWSWFKTYPRLTGTQAWARYFGAKTFAKIVSLKKKLILITKNQKDPKKHEK